MWLDRVACFGKIGPTTKELNLLGITSTMEKTNIPTRPGQGMFVVNGAGYRIPPMFCYLLSYCPGCGKWVTIGLNSYN